MSLTNPKSAGTTTINYVVMSILNRLKQYSMRNYSYLEQILIEGYTDLNMWHLNNIEVVYLRMSEAKTVTLPCDFIDYCKIGIPINGKIRVLTNDENILFPRKFADGEDVGNVGDNVNSNLYFTNHYCGSNYVNSLYGLSGGVDGAKYRVDKEKRTIIFSGSVPRAEIVLEYISSGVSLQGTTVIPREAVSTLRAYLLWQIIENDRKVSMNEKERKKAQYEEEVAAMRFFQLAPTADEYRRNLYKSIKQSIKR
jgi:hypothetical protein